MNAISTPHEIKVKVRAKVYNAILTPDLVAGGYTIAIRELPGVFTEADTVPEARSMVRDVVGLWLDEVGSA